MRKILADNFAIGRKASWLSPLLGGLLMGYSWVMVLWRVTAPWIAEDFWELTWLGAIPVAVGIVCCIVLLLLKRKGVKN